MPTIAARINKYIGYKIQDRKIHNFNKNNRATERFNDFSKHIIISGEPRGGTTWLMEALMGSKQLIVWEPLHPVVLESYNVSDFGRELGHMPYIPEDAEWPEAKSFFDELFNGFLPLGLKNNYSYAKKEFGNVDSLIFKFCRANMLLPWLTREFPQIKPIYLVRHPLSVISSQFRHPAFNLIGLNNSLFDYQHSKYDDIFMTYSNNIKNIKTKEAMYANWWAIQNVHALTHTSNRWLTVSYESMFLNPEFELKRISDYTGLDLSHVSIEKVKSPSATTKAGSGILNGGDQLFNFKKHLNKTQIEEMLTIIQSYGIHCYSEEVEPDYTLLPGYSYKNIGKKI